MTGGLRFTIPGDPRGKGRPRFSNRGGIVRTYTDDKTASYENLVALAAAAALQGRPPFTGPVSVFVHAAFGVPKSASASARAAMLGNEVKHTKLPDLDNVVKAVLDGCNAVAFVDDRQVFSITAHKSFSHTPRVEIGITPA